MNLFSKFSQQVRFRKEQVYSLQFHMPCSRDMAGFQCPVDRNLEYHFNLEPHFFLFFFFFFLLENIYYFRSYCGGTISPHYSFTHFPLDIWKPGLGGGGGTPIRLVKGRSSENLTITPKGD